MKTRGRRAERGAILVIVLASILVLAGAIVGLLVGELARCERSTTEGERHRALGVAESGIDAVAVLLSANEWPAGSSLDWSSDATDNDGDGLVDEGDESLTADAELWGSDLEDNDGDGDTDEGDEAIARVSCAATIGVSSVTLTGWLRRVESALPLGAPGALNLLDPNADVNFNGNAFRVNGNDTNLNGTPGPTGSLYGISINGDPAQIVGQLSGQQLDNVIGQGGWPSIGPWSPGDPNFVQGMVDLLEPSASIHFDHYSGTFNGNLGNLATGQVLVAHSNGTLQIGGGSTGVGVLLVEGDLEVSGGWTYIGYVFVSGRIRIVGGGGTTSILGTVFVGGDVEQPAGGGGVTSTVDALISGSVSIGYSSEALNLVRLALGSWSVVAVTEP